MKKPNFIPVTDIDIYLNNNINIYIYNDLTDYGRRQSSIDPLNFLNLLHEQLGIFKANKNRPLAVKNHLENLNITDEERYYLLEHLSSILSESAYNLKDGTILDAEIERCLKLINFDIDETIKIHDAKIPVQVDDEYDIYWGRYDFKKIKLHLETLTVGNMKIQYLIEIKNEYQQDILTHSTFENIEKGTFDQKCDMEIAKLRELSSLEQPLNNPKSQQQFDRFTNSQIVLIFYYFFKFNGLEPRVSIDIAPIAKFIHLITGKDFTTIPNSDFYKKLKSVPNFKSDKDLMIDLEVIKPFFKTVQLNEIVKMIENEIDQARTELNQNRKKK